jgi:hypothetical protein
LGDVSLASDATVIRQISFAFVTYRLRHGNISGSAETNASMSRMGMSLGI